VEAEPLRVGIEYQLVHFYRLYLYSTIYLTHYCDLPVEPLFSLTYQDMPTQTIPTLSGTDWKGMMMILSGRKYSFLYLERFPNYNWNWRVQAQHLGYKVQVAVNNRKKAFLIIGDLGRDVIVLLV
jgi:hypothetical protein